MHSDLPDRLLKTQGHGGRSGPHQWLMRNQSERLTSFDGAFFTGGTSDISGVSSSESKETALSVRFSQ